MCDTGHEPYRLGKEDGGLKALLLANCNSLHEPCVAQQIT